MIRPVMTEFSESLSAGPVASAWALPQAGAAGFTTQVLPGRRPGPGGQQASRDPQGPPVKPEIVLPQSPTAS